MRSSTRLRRALAGSAFAAVLLLAGFVAAGPARAANSDTMVFPGDGTIRVRITTTPAGRDEPREVKFRIGSDDGVYFCGEEVCSLREYTSPPGRSGSTFDIDLGEYDGGVRLSDDSSFSVVHDSAGEWTFTRRPNPSESVYTVRLTFVRGSEPTPGGTPTATPTSSPPSTPPSGVTDTVARPRVAVSVTPRNGSTADVYTATVLGSCPNGTAPTARVGTIAENYQLPGTLALGDYDNSASRVVLVEQRVRNGTTTFRFKAAMPGTVHVYPFCGGTQVAVGTFTVSGLPYAALGDSYSSGEGASSSDFLAGTDYNNVGCHRAKSAWPRIVAKDARIAVAQQAFVACSGAVVADFYTVNARWIGSTEAETAQLEHVVPSATRLVTFTVGGNDVGFEKVLSACVVGVKSKGKFGCRNDATLTSAIDANLAALEKGITIPQGTPGARPLKKTLADLYVDVASRLAPRGRLVVGGYPRLFGTDKDKGYKSLVIQDVKVPFCQVLPGYLVGFGDATWINDVDARGNAAINRQIDVARARLATTRPDVRIDYADAWASFRDHSLCDKQSSWLNGLQITTAGEKRQSFHPNGDGQSKGYAPAFRTALAH
jgi:hypothetical protein